MFGEVLIKQMQERIRYSSQDPMPWSLIIMKQGTTIFFNLTSWNPRTWSQIFLCIVILLPKNVLQGTLQR